MSYTALYRKWRPNTFEDVKGQDHIVRTLTNQIETDRVGHAYLFAERVEPVRRPLPRFLRELLIANIR